MTPELVEAIAAVKRDRLGGVATAEAGIIASYLPSHLRPEFWNIAVERHLTQETARLDAADHARTGAEGTL